MLSCTIQQTRIEAERLENERSLTREKERIDKAKAALVAEQKVTVNCLYLLTSNSMKDCANLRIEIFKQV